MRLWPRLNFLGMARRSGRMKTLWCVNARRGFRLLAAASVAVLAPGCAAPTAPSPTLPLRTGEICREGYLGSAEVSTGPSGLTIRADCVGVAGRVRSRTSKVLPLKAWPSQNAEIIDLLVPPPLGSSWRTRAIIATDAGLSEATSFTVEGRKCAQLSLRGPTAAVATRYVQSNGDWRDSISFHATRDCSLLVVIVGNRFALVSLDRTTRFRLYAIDFWTIPITSAQRHHEQLGAVPLRFRGRRVTRQISRRVDLNLPDAP